LHPRPGHGDACPRLPEADLLLGGARLLTLAPRKEEHPRVGPTAGDVGPIVNGWVAARDGAIVATGHGESHDRLQLVESAVVRNAEGRLVMPGLVDPHTHLCYAGERWADFHTRRNSADSLAGVGV